MKKLFITLFLIIITSASVQAFENKAMDKLMESWVGENINTVIDIWGYPTKEKEILGRKLYYWEKIGDNVGYINNSGLFFSQNTNCTKIYETDKNNIIIKWQWEGNDCPFTYIGVKKYVNPQNNYWEKQKELKQNEESNPTNSNKVKNFLKHNKN